MISLIQGNSADLLVTVTVDAVAYDVTNHKIWFTVKVDKTDVDANALLQVTTSSGNIVITNGPGGLVRISLTPEETQLLPLSGTLYCDIQVRSPEGKVYTVFFDQIQMTERVTKSFDIV